jgi:FAD-linked oxidoreductase
LTSALTRRALLQLGAAGAAAAWLPGCSPDTSESVPAGATFVPGKRLPWRNWSGHQVCVPAGRLAPASEEELVVALRETPGPLRPGGAGHSFSPLVPSDGTLVFLDQLDGVIEVDPEALQAEVWAGTRLSALGPVLADHGQAEMNLPDIAYQTLGGAIATSTHGTGVELGSLSSYVVGLTLVTASGEVLRCDAGQNAQVFQAARTSLGALGVVTRVRLQNRAPYRLREQVEFVELEDALARLDDHRSRHRHFELMPFPNSSLTILISTDETDDLQVQLPPDDPGAADLLLRVFEVSQALPVGGEAMYDAVISAVAGPSERVGPSFSVLTHHRISRFNEMEYTVPAEAGPACLTEILNTIREREIPIAFPLEYRYVKRDDVWLSMFHERDGCSISVHQFADRDYAPYFDVVEPIFWKYEGRPHWGKLHSLGAEQLAALYPRWRDFLEVRRALDPEGRLLNSHLRHVLGVYS